jgi:hypothetical protein
MNGPIWLVWNSDDSTVEFHTYVLTPTGSLDHVLASLPATAPPAEDA